jgi:methylmalonyl-CoA mutase cobalamin-binding domain/chain
VASISRISTSFTINGTAAIIYAMYLAVADKHGVPREKLTGTIQNDILKEYVARGTWIFPVKPSLRLIADTILFSNDATPRFNPISIAGALVRDAGATAVEEMAYTLANGLAYVDELRRRGGDATGSAAPVVLFLRAHGFLRRSVQVPRRAPHLGAAHARALRRAGPARAAFPLRRGVRRLLSRLGATLQQHHAGGDRNDGGRAGRRAIHLHLRLR